MTNQKAKAVAREKVAALVESFRSNEDDLRRTAYNEAQVRTDYISPLLQALGWDVYNLKNRPLRLREVIEETTVDIGKEKLSKRPDYELRLARQRKLFVEAKKPSIRIESDRSSAFQVRRYGYSASLPISILTNFYQLAVYDCIPAPNESDAANVARISILMYDEYIDRFDELWDIMSRELVYTGAFDQRFEVGATRHGAEQFDDLFLRQIRHWRLRLASDIHVNCPSLSSEELNYVVQLFICRIVFLRICEDREIEKYETLRNLDPSDTFNALMKTLKRADAFYNSGLFRLFDDAPLGVEISDETLQPIISELYYPQSPYTFSVVETEVLGQIYEQLLGEAIHISGGSIDILEKPESVAGGGVVPTPQYIADSIVERSLVRSIAGKPPCDMEEFTVADICCGSGTFLLSAYEALMEHHLSYYSSDDSSVHVPHRIYEIEGGQWNLTFREKRRILLEHIRGVDIDPNAVNVTQFSLLLKLIENETKEDLQDFVDRHGGSALPCLDHTIVSGNSLVSQAEWIDALGPMPDELIPTVNPLNWKSEFPDEIGRGGFDVILGNPPYIRIQNMANYSREEVLFYQNGASPYSTASQDNFDKYSLFLERALGLLRTPGRLGFIVPHKFMTIQSGRTLRRLLAHKRVLEEIVHFGANQVFGPGTSNYTSILIFDRRGTDHVNFEKIDQLEEWRYGNAGRILEIPANEIGEDPWEFVSRETRILFSHVQSSFPARLGDVAEIFVGVQTSADSIFIFNSVEEDAATVTLKWKDREWPIERAVLRPCLLDVSLTAFTRPQANAWIIFPYEIVPDGVRRRARPIPPVDMADRFPVCWDYLNTRRRELDMRNVSGGRAEERQWYQYGRSQSLVKFDGPKIILPILSLDACYSYDDTNIVVTGGGNGPYYLLRSNKDSRVSDHYLLAVLHHPLSEAIVRANTSVFRGGYYSHGKQFIRYIPIPIPTEPEIRAVEATVIALIDAVDAAANSRTPQERLVWKRQADELRVGIEGTVSDFMGITTKDMELIRSVPVPY